MAPDEQGDAKELNKDDLKRMTKEDDLYAALQTSDLDDFDQEGSMPSYSPEWRSQSATEELHRVDALIHEQQVPARGRPRGAIRRVEPGTICPGGKKLASLSLEDCDLLLAGPVWCINKDMVAARRDDIAVAMSKADLQARLNVSL